MPLPHSYLCYITEHMDPQTVKMALQYDVAGFAYIAEYRGGRYWDKQYTTIEKYIYIYILE